MSIISRNGWQLFIFFPPGIPVSLVKFSYINGFYLRQTSAVLMYSRKKINDFYMVYLAAEIRPLLFQVKAIRSIVSSQMILQNLDLIRTNPYAWLLVVEQCF